MGADANSRDELTDACTLSGVELALTKVRYPGKTPIGSAISDRPILAPSSPWSRRLRRSPFRRSGSFANGNQALDFNHNKRFSCHNR